MVCSLRASVLLLSLIQCINPISATQQKNSLQSLRRQLKNSTKQNKTTTEEEGPYYVVKARETMALYADVYPTLQDLQSSVNPIVTIDCILHHPLESPLIVCHNRKIHLNITASVHKDTGILSYTDADGKIVDVVTAEKKSDFMMNDNGRTNARDGPGVDTIVDKQKESSASSSSQWVYVKNQSMWLIPTVTILLVGTILFMIYCTCCCCQERDEDDDDDMNKKLQDDTVNTHQDNDHSGSAVFQDIDLTNIDILDEYSNRYEFDDPEVNIKEVPKVTPEVTKL